MEIKQKDKEGRGLFYIEENHNRVAELIYAWSGTDRIMIEHVEVDPEMRGKGLGNQLVRGAVDFARNKGIKITPLCYFARSVFNMTEEFKDVL